MAIDRVEIFVVHFDVRPVRAVSIAPIPVHDFAYLRLTDSDGAVGWGESYLSCQDKVYSQLPGSIEEVDSVVLACGGVPNGELFSQLRGRHASVHVLGDAFAPRRVIHGAKQAYALVSGLS